MRIIKEVNQEYSHKCRYCESIYAYTSEDVDYVWFNHIRCPVCKRLDSTSVFDKKVRKWQKKWQEKKK